VSGETVGRGEVALRPGLRGWGVRAWGYGSMLGLAVCLPRKTRRPEATITSFFTTHRGDCRLGAPLVHLSPEASAPSGAGACASAGLGCPRTCLFAGALAARVIHVFSLARLAFGRTPHLCERRQPLPACCGGGIARSLFGAGFEGKRLMAINGTV